MTYSIGVPTLVFYSSPRGTTHWTKRVFMNPLEQRVFINPPESEHGAATVGMYFSEETAIWSTQSELDWPT